MKGIVIASHGKLAEGMLDTLKLFSGEPEQIEALCLLPGQEIQDFLNNLKEAIKRVNMGDGVVVFCDLLFGTPCNCSGSLLNDSLYSEQIDVITGMSLPLILEFIGSRENDISTESLIQIGKDGIVDFKKLYQDRKIKK